MDGAGLERRLGDHRLHHPTLTERLDRLGDDQRRCAHHDGLHRDRSDQRHPLLLPGLRQNAAGNSPSSNDVNAIPRTVPSAPRTLTAAPTNVSGQVRLTWLAPASNGGSAITDYIIQRSPNGTTAGRRSATVSHHELHRDRADQRHPLLLPGLRPQRRRQQPGEQRRQRRSAHPAVAPPLVGGRGDEPVGPGPSDLVAPSRTVASAVTDYIIQRSPNGTTGGRRSATAHSATAYTATGLVNGARYYFRVFAHNAAGNSPSEQRRQTRSRARSRYESSGIRRVRRLGASTFLGRPGEHR